VATGLARRSKENEHAHRKRERAVTAACPTAEAITRTEANPSSFTSTGNTGGEEGTEGAKEMTITPDLAAIAEASTEVREALHFNDAPDLKVGKDYKWVVAHAKEQYARAMAHFKMVDEKASTLVGYLSGSLGVMILGLIGTVAVDKLNAIVGLLSLPSFMVGLTALILAILARRPFRTMYGGPPIPWAAQAAGMSPDDGPGEAAGLGLWALTTSFVSWSANQKARWYNASVWALAVTLGLLVLPAIGVIILKW